MLEAGPTTGRGLYTDFMRKGDNSPTRVDIHLQHILRHVKPLPAIGCVPTHQPVCAAPAWPRQTASRAC